MGTQQPVDGYFQPWKLTLHCLQWCDTWATPLVLPHHVNPQSQTHTWDNFSARMSLDRRVVGLDMRSYGDSQWASEGNYTTEDFASDVDALVKYLYMDRGLVLGGSL